MPPLFEQSAASDTTSHEPACGHTRLGSMNGPPAGESADVSFIEQQQTGRPDIPDHSELSNNLAVQEAASDAASVTQDWYNYVLELSNSNRPCKDDPDFGLFGMLPELIRSKIWKLAFGITAVIEITLAKGPRLPLYYLCGISASLLRVNARLHDECAPYFFREAIYVAASKAFWEEKCPGRRGYFPLLPREWKYLRR